MTDQHTPGPWYVKGAAILPEAPSFNWIGSVQASNMPEWEANARLIAASPEMWDLIVVGVFLAFTTGDEELTAEEVEWREKAVALIAKVRGTQ
jgi:hypothetical protein